MYTSLKSNHFSKFDHDFDGAYLISTLNPNNKTWEQQLNQIFKILDNCHINIKSNKIKDLIKSWYFTRQKQTCPGYWNLNSNNYHYETEFKKQWDNKYAT